MSLTLAAASAVVNSQAAVLLQANAESLILTVPEALWLADALRDSAASAVKHADLLAGAGVVLEASSRQPEDAK